MIFIREYFNIKIWKKIIIIIMRMLSKVEFWAFSQYFPKRWIWKERITNFLLSSSVPKRACWYNTLNSHFLINEEKNKKRNFENFLFSQIDWNEIEILRRIENSCKILSFSKQRPRITAMQHVPANGPRFFFIFLKAYSILNAI